MKEKLLDIKLRIPEESPTILILKRINSCKKRRKEVIDFPTIFSKLAVSLQLPKEKVWSLLFYLNDLSLLRIIPGHGIKMNWELKNGN